MLASVIIRPYFFENEAGNAVTVNAGRYVEMLQNFFTPQLARFPVNENKLFQQDEQQATQQECQCFVPKPSCFQEWRYPMAPQLP